MSFLSDETATATQLADCCRPEKTASFDVALEKRSTQAVLRCTDYVLMKVHLARLLRYATHKAFKRKMDKFYAAKCLAKCFRLYRTVASEERSRRRRNVQVASGVQRLVAVAAKMVRERVQRIRGLVRLNAIIRSCTASRILSVLKQFQKECKRKRGQKKKLQTAIAQVRKHNCKVIQACLLTFRLSDAMGRLS